MAAVCVERCSPPPTPPTLWESRGSIFARMPGGRNGILSRRAVASSSASKGAACFIIGVQILVACVLFFCVPVGQLSLFLLLPMACVFNAVMLWNWAPDPGFVSEPVEPSCEDERAILRWCSLCRLWQPLRAKHCDCCERCVRKYDHHCFWIGGCVGETNHLRFYVLLTVTSPYLMCLLLNLLKCLSIRDCATMDAAIVRNIVPFVLVLVDGFMLFLITALWGFQGVLLARNQTTWEFSSRHRITYLSSSRGNPFDRGFCTNVAFLFQRKPINWFRVLWRNKNDVV